VAVKIRVQKYLSEKGIVSRRKAEQWITAGYIFINGEKVTTLGTRLDPEKDRLTIDPRATAATQYHYFLFNKPEGIVTVNPAPGEKAIKDIVDLPADVVPVGRLDKDSSGLILLTNDGVAARRIMAPLFAHEKEYEVIFYGPVTDAALNQIAKGMVLFGKKTRPVRIKKVGPDRVYMTLTEGKNRQIRRMGEKVGFPVKALTRVRLLNFTIDDIPQSSLHELHGKELEELYRILKLDRVQTPR
jgi:23S rRNA pseudouridine2605 synthase